MLPSRCTHTVSDRSGVVTICGIVVSTTAVAVRHLVGIFVLVEDGIDRPREDTAHRAIEHGFLHTLFVENAQTVHGSEETREENHIFDERKSCSCGCVDAAQLECAQHFGEKCGSKAQCEGDDDHKRKKATMLVTMFTWLPVATARVSPKTE